MAADGDPVRIDRADQPMCRLLRDALDEAAVPERSRRVLLEHAAAREPDSSSVCEALARAYYDSGRFEPAATSFARLLTLVPTSDYGHFGLGLALTRLDRFELASEHLAMAAAMRPDRPEYVDRLKQARATLRARRATGPDAPR